MQEDELLRNGRLQKNAEITPAMLLSGLLLEQGPLGLLLAAAGAFHLLARREGREARWLGVAMVLVLVALSLAGGKPYYLGPAFPPLFAAGAVLAEALLPAWRPLRVAAVALTAGLVLPAAPIAIPLLEPSTTVAWMERLGVAPVRTERAFTQPLPQHQADQLGWPGQVAAVRAVVEGLPPGERATSPWISHHQLRAVAAARTRDPRRGRRASARDHNPHRRQSPLVDLTALVARRLGGRREDYASDFGEVELAGRTPALPDGMPYESAVPVYVLRGPRAPVAELFKASKNYQ